MQQLMRKSQRGGLASTENEATTPSGTPMADVGNAGIRVAGLHRVHASASAQDATAALNARASALGADLFLTAGRGDPAAQTDPSDKRAEP